MLLFTREVSVSHNPSEIILICWFAAQETFLIIINVKNSFAAEYFVETMIPLKHLYKILKEREINHFIHAWKW